MPLKPLTPRLESTWLYIASYIHHYHLPPTVKEIRVALRLESISTVYYRLDELQALGYIEGQPEDCNSRDYTLFVWPYPRHLHQLYTWRKLVWK